MSIIFVNPNKIIMLNKGYFMNPYDTLIYILLGAILGGVGQGIRIIVGIKKQFDQIETKDKKWNEWLETKRLFLSILISLIVGSIAGALFAISLTPAKITQETLIGMITAG